VSDYLTEITEAMLARCTPRMREAAEHLMDGKTVAETACAMGVHKTRVYAMRDRMGRVFRMLSRKAGI